MKITVSSIHVLHLGMIRLLVKSSISLDMNQFVEGHQITQQSAIYVKKEFFKLSNLQRHLQIHSYKKFKPKKESNLKIREETNMFPSMAFTQDLDRFDTDNILSITENELPTDVSNHPELLSHMSKSC